MPADACAVPGMVDSIIISGVLLLCMGVLLDRHRVVRCAVVVMLVLLQGLKLVVTENSLMFVFVSACCRLS
jgi:hypothetical protein